MKYYKLLSIFFFNKINIYIYNRKYKRINSKYSLLFILNN